MPENVRVYVVFMDDHHLHKEVVHWFCSFLKQDLGLDVRLNIWEEGQVATNLNKYMMMQVTNADKVCYFRFSPCKLQPMSNVHMLFRSSLSVLLVRKIV